MKNFMSCSRIDLDLIPDKPLPGDNRVLLSFTDPAWFVQLNPDTWKRCKSFALESVNSSKSEYSRRGQDFAPKIVLDIAMGKLAECAVCNLMYYLGHKSTLPDFNVYTKYEKSFDADLVANRTEIHVKSITEESLKKHGESWMFEKKDPLERGVIALCVVINDKTVRIRGFIDVRDVVWGEPRKQSLKTKKCIYLEDQDLSQIYIGI